MKNTPHKHAAVIKAWADGAEIEYFDGTFWIPSPTPHWRENIQYRVKPVFPTLGQIAKDAWYASAALRCWDNAAKAVYNAVKSGEYQPIE